MASKFQTVVRGVLLAVQAAITAAWDETREQVADYDWRIRQTCFGQILLMNVMQRVRELDSSNEHVRVHLKPNRKKTAYHLEVEMPGFLATVSAVRHEVDTSRYAFFRSEIASLHQSYFTYSEDDGSCQFCPPDAVPDSLTSYIQILHGPRDNRDNREKMGFIRVAFLDRSKGEEWCVTTLANFLEALDTSGEDLLDSFAPKPPAVEEIIDLLSEQFGLLGYDHRGRGEGLDQDEDEEASWR